MDLVTTTDFYEAAYYLVNDCVIDAIECLPVNGKASCKFSFTGEELPTLQLQYFRSTAEVNLLQFRRAYGQLSSYAYEAKKRWKQEQRLLTTQGGQV